jgi:hypothetical protein
MLAKASQEGASRALIAKERGAARLGWPAQSTLTEAPGGVGSTHRTADRRAPEGTGRLS